MPRWLLNVVLVCCAIIALVVAYVLVGVVANRGHLGQLEKRPPTTIIGTPGERGPAGPAGATVTSLVRPVPTTRRPVATTTTRPAGPPPVTTAPTTTTTRPSPPPPPPPCTTVPVLGRCL